MGYGLTAARDGDFHRLAEPVWENPLDTSHSKERGGRWNPRGSFGALYLNATVALARLLVAHKLAGQPYGVEDLDESEQHDLVTVRVPAGEYLDCVTAAGLRAVGLPAVYPAGPRGPVPWDDCQPVGQAAYDAGGPGVACRSALSAASAGDEELGVFDRVAAAVTMTARRAFADWYWR